MIWTLPPVRVNLAELQFLTLRNFFQGQHSRPETPGKESLPVVPPRLRVFTFCGQKAQGARRKYHGQWEHATIYPGKLRGKRLRTSPKEFSTRIRVLTGCGVPF